MAKIKLGKKSYNLPGSKMARIVIGILLILGGCVGFLPILGFWMIPLGLLVLSVDSPLIRRMRRKLEVRIARYWRKNKDSTESVDNSKTENS